jgi:DNA-binding SARP family transcriptional activator
VESTPGSYGWDNLERPLTEQSDASWSETIDLLKLVQDDYVDARKQLDIVSQAMAEREALVNERLQYALLEATGHRTMCLVPYRVGFGGATLGKTTLGGHIPRPMILPKKHALQVRCLGRFTLSYDGKTVGKWQSVKAKSLFECLMIKPREPVVKEALMEVLWPDCDPQSANNNLKSAIHGLRRTLDQLPGDGNLNPVVFTQGSYLIDPDVDLWLDVEEFEEHWTAGRRLEKENRKAEATREFEAGEQLYRGDYLQDEPYEEWTLLRREALRDIYMAILIRLADYVLGEKDYLGCIGYCQKILGKDPCREDAYRKLMQSYSRLGQRNRALRWYEICRRTVKIELDATPDNETETLYRQLLNNQPI